MSDARPVGGSRLVAAPLAWVLFEAAGADASPPDPREARRVAEAWRDEVRAALRVHGEVPEWQEAAREPAAALPVSGAAVRAVRLLAVLADRGDVPWPDAVPDALDTVPVWQDARGDDFQTTPLAQVALPDIWLPGSVRATCRTRAPWGDTLVAGSLGSLVEQLELLDGRTLQMGEPTPDALAEVGGRDDASGAVFVLAAAAGLLTMRAAARTALDQGLPLILVD